MIHRSDNRMHWQPPPAELVAARASTGWKKFHRECSRHELFFDDVNRSGRNQWSAVAYVIRNNTRYVVAQGSGKCPTSAVQSAFDIARQERPHIPYLSVAGDPIDDLIG